MPTFDKHVEFEGVLSNGRLPCGDVCIICPMLGVHSRWIIYWFFCTREESKQRHAIDNSTKVQCVDYNFSHGHTLKWIHVGILNPYIRESTTRVSKIWALKWINHGIHHYVEKSHPPWNSLDGVSKFKPHESMGLKIQNPMKPTVIQVWEIRPHGIWRFWDLHKATIIGVWEFKPY